MTRIHYLFWHFFCFITTFVTANYNLKHTNNNTTTTISRIVGGTDAPRDDYQFFVRVNMNRQSSCGGSLIGEEWIVTAAHCVIANLETFATVPANQVEVVVTQRLVGQQQQQTYQAANWWVHPEFQFIQGVDRLSSINDICLIQLTTPIRNIPIVSINPNAIFPLDNVMSRLHVVGIGLTNPDLSIASVATTLQHATTGVVPHADCAAQMNERGFPILQESMICIHDDNSQPCFGDSGGPLFSGDRDIGYTLLGTAAFGAGDCQSLYPMVYMRISYYVDWMESILQPFGDALTLVEEFSTGSSSGSSTPEILCFSSQATVELKDGRTIPMTDLQLGDFVLTDASQHNGKYEPVYTFGHYHTSIKAEYLVIQTTSSSSSAPLEVSPNHLLFTTTSKDHHRRLVVLAGNLTVGDTIVVGKTLERITSIQTRWRRGAYAPFTPSGTIVVNGIPSSCFAMLPNSIHIMAHKYYYNPTVLYHNLALVMESPHRLFCRFMVDDNNCHRWERYNPEGISIWVQGPMKLLQCHNNNNVGCSFVLTMGILLVGIFVYLPEQLLLVTTTSSNNHPIQVVVLLLLLLLLFVRSGTKQQTTPKKTGVTQESSTIEKKEKKSRTDSSWN